MKNLTVDDLRAAVKKLREQEEQEERDGITLLYVEGYGLRKVKFIGKNEVVILDE